MLPPSPSYTPWARGGYEVAPGLKMLGTDFGNGHLDRQLFQVDEGRTAALANKRSAFAEDPRKYRGAVRLEEPVERAAVNLIVDRLTSENPAHFACEGGRLMTPEGPIDLAPVGDGRVLDELALRVAEDLCVIRRASGGEDWTAYLNLCAPSHWAMEDKLGQSFFAIHVPVPGMERINAASAGIVDGMIRKGPFVRFVWTIESDDRLNHHPRPPQGVDPDEWQGRRFDRAPFWMRVERQCTWGLPEVAAALFTIRVLLTPGEQILADPARRDSLVAALESMSPSARAYKGLDVHWDALMRQLRPEG